MSRQLRRALTFLIVACFFVEKGWSHEPIAGYFYHPDAISGPLTVADARRLAQVQRQLLLQDSIRWDKGLASAPQSIGQVQVQTGPNRWESFPVYPRPVTSAHVKPLRTAPPARSILPVAPPRPRAPVQEEPALEELPAPVPRRMDQLREF